MSDGSQNDGWQLLDALIPLLFFTWLIVASWRRRRRPREVADGPAGEPYAVFTTRFNQVPIGRDVPGLLAGNLFLRARGWGAYDGIGFAVARYYMVSGSARDLDELPTTLATLVGTMLAQDPEERRRG